MFHFGHVLLAVGEQVGDQPHARLGRVDEVPARDVLLEDVVLDRAGELLARHALLLGDQLVEQQQHGGRRVDRHRGRDLVERDAVEGHPHVLERVDRHAGAADLAQAARVVGVQAELGRQVEGHAQAGRPVLEQVLVALVGLAGGGVAGVLAHRPAALAVHLAVDAAGEGELARLAEVEVLGQVRLRVERLDLDPGVREAAGVVRADDRRDGEVGRVLVLDGHGRRVPRGSRPASSFGSPSTATTASSSPPRAREAISAAAIRWTSITWPIRNSEPVSCATSPSPARRTTRRSSASERAVIATSTLVRSSGVTAASARARSSESRRRTTGSAPRPITIGSLSRRAWPTDSSSSSASTDDDGDPALAQGGAEPVADLAEADDHDVVAPRDRVEADEAGQPAAR